MGCRSFLSDSQNASFYLLHLWLVNRIAKSECKNFVVVISFDHFTHLSQGALTMLWF